MMRLFNFALFFVFLLGNFSNAQNLDINYDCTGTPCEVNLPIECKEQPAEFKGNILSPGFPLKITNETQFGIYTLLITANCPFTIELTLNRPNFLIGLPDNTFSIGVGDTVNSEFIGSPLKGTEQFPDSQDTLYYNKSGSSSVWVQIDVSKGFFWFEIAYTVTDAKAVLLTPCDQNDSYGVNWKTYKNETMEKNCSVGVPDALGTAFWKCICINNQCKFETSQPDFTECQSSGLVNITESINNPDISVTEIWILIEQFTASKGYYGQEIFQILFDAVDALLQRMQREIDENKNSLEAIDFLEIQMNSSFYATQTMDHLVTNDAQWNQLIIKEKGEEEILELLRVSNDIGFRLSNVSELAALPLLCEIPFDNVTIMSSYWDETQDNISDCTLENVLSKEDFYRFPINDTGKIESYIVLPNQIKDKSYKTAGVFIAASKLIQLLLPGSENSQEMEYKEVNSPLISYTLYNPKAQSSDEEAPLPNDAYVQLVFKHEVNTKYPSYRTLRRDPDYEGEESAVMGSSICSFLELNKSNSYGNWTWDDEGCRVLSTNSTHTVCKCTHLTGFADLMDFHDFVGRSAALDTTSMTCTILSIICLVSTFCILIIFRALKMKRTFVTQNLCITLIISYFMILLTLDKRFLGLDEATCAVMGIMLHYMFLTSFMWMLLEGFQLYRMSVNVFDVLTRKWTVYYAIVAYTVPFFIVGVTVLAANSFEPTRSYDETSDDKMTGIMQAYSGEETCWLVGDWVWAFNGPVAVIIVANCRFLFTGIASSYKSIRNSKSNPQELIRGMCLRVLSLTFLLGISWIFGFLLYTEWIAFAFIFTIANGLQGVVIFFDRCILNKKIRKAITANLTRLSISVSIKWEKSTVTSKGPTGQTDLQNDSFSNMFDRSFSLSNESIEEIIPRIKWQNFKNSSLNSA